jgi:hypothetical protein
MKKLLATGSVIGVTAVLTGCGITTPAAPPMQLTNMEAFTIIVPKNVNNTNTWNVKFNSFQRKLRGSTPEIPKHFRATHTEVGENEIKFDFCNTETFSNTSVYKSCVTYTSDVVTKDLGENTEITIQPKLRTETKGGLLIPISIPNIDHDYFYGYLSRHSITTNGKITSEFPSESIKGNFDRMASRYSWKSGKADAAHRQFQDTYVIKTSSGVEGRVSMGFYPYREGSIVQYVVDGTSKTNNAARKVDWSKAMKEISKTIEQIVNS